ncbi:MAG: NAD(P)-dependent oxidoreductase [Paracoccaceae bacterium]
MKAFPLFLNVVGRPVVVVGGGEQAAQKARLVAKTEARLVLMAPALDDELAARVDRGEAEHVATVVDEAAFEGVDLAFVATGCPGADASIAAVARARGALVNVVDRPALCDVTTPAIVDRDPVVVAIGTEGAAPVLARQIKSALERTLEPALGAFAALAGELRPRVERSVVKERRRAFWDWAFDGPPRRLFTADRREEAMAAIEGALAAGGAPGATGGQVSFVDVAHGEADLVALRAVARLQAADLIVHDEAVSPAILELARRDAERRALPPDPDAAETIGAAVAEGARVVHLAALPWPLGAIVGRLAERGVAIEQIGPAARPDAA